MGLLKDRTLILLIIILCISLVILGFFITTNDRGIHLYDINKIHWYEYKMSVGGSTAPTPDGRGYVEYWDMITMYNTVAYNGVSDARHMREIDLVHDNYSLNITIKTDLYFDPANNYSLLGGLEYWNNTKYEIMANNSNYQTADPTTKFLKPGDINITYSGNETVTVPAGTFNCTKYTTEGDWNVTYWHANNVPVPVKKVAISQVYYYNICELVDYG